MFAFSEPSSVLTLTSISSLALTQSTIGPLSATPVTVPVQKYADIDYYETENKLTVSYDGGKVYRSYYSSNFQGIPQNFDTISPTGSVTPISTITNRVGLNQFKFITVKSHYRLQEMGWVVGDHYAYVHFTYARSNSE
jgi:hypothetical protein